MPPGSSFNAAAVAAVMLLAAVISGVAGVKDVTVAARPRETLLQQAERVGAQLAERGNEVNTAITKELKQEVERLVGAKAWLAEMRGVIQSQLEMIKYQNEKIERARQFVAIDAGGFTESKDETHKREWLLSDTKNRSATLDEIQFKLIPRSEKVLFCALARRAISNPATAADLKYAADQLGYSNENIDYEFCSRVDNVPVQVDVESDTKIDNAKLPFMKQQHPRKPAAAVQPPRIA